MIKISHKFRKLRVHCCITSANLETVTLELELGCRRCQQACFACCAPWGAPLELVRDNLKAL